MPGDSSTIRRASAPGRKPAQAAASGHTRFALAVTAVFLLSCLPSGRIIARLFLGRRATVLGNRGLGASRVAREVGLVAGLLVFILDAAKGALPVLWARRRGLSSGRRGLLGFVPLLPSVFVNQGRGAASAAGTALAEDPAALGLVAPVLGGGLVLRRHPQSVLLGYLLLTPARLLLRRDRPAVAWTAASMALVILARARGSSGWPSSRAELWQRLWYDRDGGIAGDRLSSPKVGAARIE